MPKKIIKKTVLILFFFLSFCLIFPFKSQAAPGINSQINFQGKVVNSDGTNVSDNDYDFEFKIYYAGTGGTANWTETWTTAGCSQLAVDDGIFQVDLGSCTSLTSTDFNQDTLFVSVEFNNDGEMTPRVRLTAAPYAMNAGKVSGLTLTNTTGTLTVPDGTTVTFSGANNLTFTTTDVTNATLPIGSITLVDLAATQGLTNKTIGSTGLVFSGAGTDLTTVSNEDLTLTANGAGDVVVSGDADTMAFVGSVGSGSFTVTLMNFHVSGADITNFVYNVLVIKGSKT